MVPRIQKEPVDTSILITQTVTLECVATGNPRPTIVWLHSGEPLRLVGRRRRLENGSQKLVITNVGQSDSGRYTCVAENEVGRDRISAYLLVISIIGCCCIYSRCIDFIVVIVPPVITPMVPDVAVPVGKCIWLPCDTQGVPPPIIEWYMGNNRVVTRNPKYQVQANGTLRICNAVGSDAGRYTCVAINRGGLTNKTTTLDIHGQKHTNEMHGCTQQYELALVTVRPGISPRLPDQWVLVDTTATYECRTPKANPKPEITWTRDRSEVLTNSGRIEISRDKTRLTINELDPFDEGDYTCIAKNVVGTDSSMGELHVIGMRHQLVVGLIKHIVTKSFHSPPCCSVPD